MSAESEFYRCGVLFSSCPWVSGSRSAGYYGVVEVEHTVMGCSWEEGIERILEAAAEEARALGGNAIVGMEIECDPYHRPGGRISFKGSSAKLEPLYAGVGVYP